MTEIILKNPVVFFDYNAVRLDHVGWHPERKEVSIRFSLGYTDPAGDWVERRDRHLTVRNQPEATDPAGAIIPADNQYDNLMKEINDKPAGVKIEQFIMEKYGLALFPGSIV